MKRILSLFLILVLMLSTLASCNLFNPNGEQAASEADIKDAIKMLEDMYEDYNGAEIPNGTELVAQIKVAKTVFTVEWTASTSKVTFELVDGFNVIKTEKVTEDEEYTLTANVKSAGGQSANISFKPMLTAASGFGMITEPQAGVAYKLALLHRNEGGVVYFDGNNYNSYAWYLSYTSDSMLSVDVYLEEVEGVEGGYRLYFNKDGEKTYIRAYPRDGDTTKGTLEMTTIVPDEYWTYSTEYNTLIYTSTTGEQFYIGSSGTYKSISCSAISYVTADTSYPCRLYGAGGVEEKLPEMELPTIPENYTNKDIVDALYQLQPGQKIEDPYKLTGVITSIKYEYDPAYNNISVVIVVDGMTDKPVLCYRLNGGADLKVGDTITVFAGLTNHNGTPETTSGGVILEVVPGTGETPNPNPNPNPSDVIVLDMMGSTNITSYSATQMIYSANGITLTNDKNTSSTDCYNNTGSYAARFYGGATIKIEYPGMTKIVLTLDDYSPEAGKDYLKGFDGMTVAGATITRDNDVVTIIFDSATDVFQSGALGSQVRIEKIEVYTGEVEGGGNVGGGDPVVTPTYEAPVAGQAYDLFMVLPSGTVYFNGKLDATKGTYLDTTTDAAASVKIYFEVVDGGYHIYFTNGDVKTYINAEAYLKSSGYAGCHFVLGDSPVSVWTYDTTVGTLEVYGEADGKSDTFFAGTYGTYSTVSMSGVYYKDQIASGTQYPARILPADGEITPPVHTHNFVDGKCACGEEDPNYVPPQTDVNALTSLKTGDKVYIVAPAYNMALSATKVATYYNKGVDVSGGFAGLTDAEIWEVTVNTDGSYTFTSLTGKVLALAADYASLNEDGENKSWTLEVKSEGIFYVKNTVRGNYLEWYASKSNWSTYATSSLSDLFEISFYAYELAEGGETPAPHEHTFVEGKCECGEEDPNYVAPHEHTFVEGKCECGEEDPNYVPPVEGGDEVVSGGSADFDSLLPGSNGSSAYTGTHTTTNGWVVTNSAVQAGGATVMNPQFPVIGADNTSKAVCLNGKTSAPGKLTSPTLNGGISKLTMDYTKMFTDTKLSVTVTITDLTTGAVYTQVVEREEDKDTKYVVWTFEWVLDTAIEGDFTIEIVNNCPTAVDSNKDRITILDLSWTK